MKIASYKCDECGVQKQESNHWVICLHRNWLEFWPWSEEMAIKSGFLHLCGEGCAAKVLSKQIASVATYELKEVKEGKLEPVFSAIIG